MIWAVVECVLVKNVFSKYAGTHMPDFARAFYTVECVLYVECVFDIE